MLDIEPQKKETLVKQQDALRVYLDSLFRMPLPEIPDDIEHIAPAPPIEIVQPTPALTKGADSMDVASEPEAETLQPNWAKTPFSCLLFEVNGLGLAVPLVELDAVKLWPVRLDHIPGATPWVLGVMRFGEDYVKVVDTSALLFSNRKSRPPDASSRDRRILVFGQRGWGLACNAVKSVVVVDPQSVKWRVAGAKRPWVLGTALDRMCALLDVGKIAASLDRGDLLV